MEKIAAFRECYERWAGWIGVNQGKISKNTIWHQCTEMMNNEFMFQALFLAGKKAKAQPEFNSYLAANAPLYRYLLDGYLSFQYMGIRRLTDYYNSKKDINQDRGVASLSRLIKDMEAHSAVITREAFVCVDGLPYDFAEAIEKERQEVLATMGQYTKGAVWLGVPGVGEKSFHRHLVFDRLSDVDEHNRQPTDTIALKYWQHCIDTLADPELGRIKNFVDKYLAHAADSLSTATLDDEDKKQTMQRIHYAQQCLIDLVHRLTFDFFGTRLAMVPTYDEAQLLYNFTKPFASAEIVEETHRELRKTFESRLSSL